MNEILNTINFIDIEPEIAPNANIVLKKRYLKEMKRETLLKHLRKCFKG